MTLIALLLAMAIGMAVYYGVTAHMSLGALIAHTPGGKFGLAVLIALAIVWVVMTIKAKRDEQTFHDEDDLTP